MSYDQTSKQANRDYNCIFIIDIVSELLGGDLMEHNILHEGIGVTDTLEILQRYHSELKQPEQYTHFYLIKTIHFFCQNVNCFVESI